MKPAMDTPIIPNFEAHQSLFETTFEEYLIHQGVSSLTRKNYRSDLRNFLDWTANSFTAQQVASIVTHRDFLKLITKDLLES
ncbi:MAG: site-specific integrase, partial [Patescibacteria group bacterium]